ncbi:glutamate receptor ionotropic, delta-1 [Patella vulgata]|uniref:glutamate receptor ionotropic, delta-1 n=1 Tax=Patella vulgata TaxID=6465 RepID=UPI0024A893B7|nr:glutamate receptor ionotropic, delta-1 [Patella vulgata]
MSVTPGRERVLDFVYPLYLAYTAVVFRLPDANKSKWRKLVAPFKWQVYVCIAASFCGVILLLYTTERLNPFYKRTKRPRSTFQGLVLYLFGALINQGGTGMPSSMSGRSMLAAWWLICSILVATYSGNLIAFLTVSKEKLPFETLNDLASQKDYKWGTLGGSSWITLFKNSNLTIYQKIWKGIQEFNKTDTGVLNYDQEYHLNKVISEDYGFIADKITAETRSSKSCKLTILKELFHPMGYAFALQNNSPYLQYFDDEIRKILESGVAQILKRPWWPKQGTCPDLPTTSQIELVDIQSAFYVIVIGISIACLTILIEGCFTKNDRVVSLRYRYVRKKTGV